MDNQQVFSEVYYLENGEGDFYLGSHRVNGKDYWGSYGKQGFIPVKKIVLAKHRNDTIAQLVEYNLISCWKSKRCINIVNHPVHDRFISEESRQKLSNSQKQVWQTEERRSKIVRNRPSQANIMKEVSKTEKFMKSREEFWETYHDDNSGLKQKHCEIMKRVTRDPQFQAKRVEKITGSGNPKAVSVKTPDGIFLTIKSCAEHYGVDPRVIHRWMKTNPENFSRLGRTKDLNDYLGRE